MFRQATISDHCRGEASSGCTSGADTALLTSFNCDTRTPFLWLYLRTDYRWILEIDVDEVTAPGPHFFGSAHHCFVKRMSLVGCSLRLSKC